MKTILAAAAVFAAALIIIGFACLFALVGWPFILAGDLVEWLQERERLQGDEMTK